MRRMIKNKTYSQAKPKALTDEQWMDQINDTLIKVAGLDENIEGGDSGDEGEGGSRENYDAAPAATTNGQPRNSIGATHQRQGVGRGAQEGGSAARPSQRLTAGAAGTVSRRSSQQTPMLVPGPAGGPQQRMSAALLGRVASRGGSRTPQLGPGGAGS
eukprot:GHUV01039267.1.p1 GENE.GHUV01039267.1~~GHUV01039267.1.p1  ORF type:complete len:158 (+),score=57.84 GHUV01039267.1:554-1027(+)